MLADLLPSLGVFLEPRMLGMLFGGVALGIFVGAVPGLTATLAIALLLPFTFGLSAVQAVILMTGIFVGGIYGGSISAIMVRVPGAPSSMMTMLDGHAMAKAGRPEIALGLATFSSFVGGIIGGLFLILLAPQLARAALRFQSPETFALVVLALITVAAVSQGTLLKGLIATVIGLMLSTVGLDVAGIPRFTLGFTQLYVGVPLIPIVIGLFALTEVFTQSGERLAKPIVLARVRLSHIFGFWPYAKKVGWKLFVKSSVIGALVGALPGAGASMASFLAYAEAKRSSKRPEKFGTGISEGIVAPEASNNAMTGGAFIPMLAFGIPGDSVTAIILGGLIIQGITPGPALFREAGTLVLPLMVGFILAYFVLLLLGLSFLPLFARLATVDQAILLPLIASVAMVAAFVSERSFFALGLTVGVGVLGYLLQRNGIPIIPVLLGVILGPILEQNFRRALTLSAGDPLVFVQSPISVVLLLSAILLAFYFGYVQPQQALLRNQSDPDDDTSEAT